MSSSNSSPDAKSSSPAQDPGAVLKVAIAFVKQYYKCVSSHPEMLERFYSPSEHHASFLSHGEGSEPAEAALLKSTHHGHDRWGVSEDEKISFDFEDGAIDAQPSQNEGILMVVTASVIFTQKGVASERRKKFVQTFFLSKIGRNFAVINDVLRFLATTEAETPAVAKSSEATQTTVDEIDASAAAAKPAATLEEATAVPTPDNETTTTPPTEAPKEEPTETETTPVADSKSSGAPAEDEVSAPGGGVEESKEEAPDEDEAAAAAAAKQAAKSKRSNSKENKKKKGKQQPPAATTPAPAASKPAPGSWASLVVSGGSAPNTPSRTSQDKSKAVSKPSTNKQALPPSEDAKENGESTADAPKKDKENKSAATNNAKPSKPDNNKSNHKTKDTIKQERAKRDPDNTLVIKNLSDNIKEQDILSMFQPFATQTKTKIVGTNLNHHRLLAFVDYDSVAPVMAALKQHKETPFEWNGKVLEVDQKTMEQRARRKAAANNPSNHNGYKHAGRGGNNNKMSNSSHHNNAAGRGERKRGTRAGR